MADKRMFSNKVIGSDAFLEMPDSTQNLYFHLSMYADDDGFVDKYKTIMRMTGKKEDDLKLLIAKSFIIPFQSGVIVIRHWRVNNYLRTDRYNETQYIEEKSKLVIGKNGEYSLGIPMVSTDKISIDQISIDKSNNNMLGFGNQNEPALSKNDTIDVVSQFEIFYKLYPCSINKNKKTSLNLYWNWLQGKHITVMGSKKLTRYNHLQLMFALKEFINVNRDKEETFIPRLPTFLGEKTLCDYVENSKEQYEKYMLEKYGEEWKKVKFEYSKDGV